MNSSDMKPRESTDNIGYSAVLEMFIEGQKENTKAIKNTESSLSRLENTVTEFVVEAKHTNREVASLRSEIHGEGGILDQLVELKMDRREKATIRRIVAWAGSILSAVGVGYVISLFTGDP
jgi:hypothetical protein